jgi:hypothetical protein
LDISDLCVKPTRSLGFATTAGRVRFSAMRYRTILLFGAPGSGKGTQGKILGQIPGFFHSATGDIFRSLDLQSETGRTI